MGHPSSMWYRQVSSIQRRIKCPISLIGVPTRNIVDIRISEALLAFKSNIQAVLPEDPKVKINLPKTAQMLGLFFAMQLLFVNTKGQNKYGDMLPYMDIEYTLNGKKSASRIYFELFWDITPKTAMNFARILEGRSIKKKKLMTYKNTVFHRIIDGFMMQGGDFEHSNGMGGYSVFEHDKFEDENFIKKHTGPGILSMANAGENTNGSQFFITFSACPHLDGRHVVFGKVRDAIDLKKIARIGKVATNRRDAPISPVKIVDCGFLNKKTYNEDREAVL